VSELVADRIRATAAKLGLPHLACSLDHLVNRADAAKMGYLDLLDLTLSEELAIREDRRFHVAAGGRGGDAEPRCDLGQGACSAVSLEGEDGFDD
jgi:hypothetical protein